MVKLYPGAFRLHLDELASALVKTLKDPYHDIKLYSFYYLQSSNLLINALCEIFKDSLGNCLQNLTKCLAANLGHNHSKVRKSTVHTISKLLTIPNAGGYYEQVRAMLKCSLGDKSTDVRKETVICVGRLLKSFGIKKMNAYEPELVGHLLYALSDPNEQIVSEAVKELESCAIAVGKMDNSIQEED